MEANPDMGKPATHVNCDRDDWPAALHDLNISVKMEWKNP
jgi:hypothetical protein